MKWTSGDWQAWASAPHSVLAVRRMREPKRIAFVEARNDPAERAANRHLIAAAPDLYEALFELATTFASRPDIQKLCGPKELGDYERARAALSKARGETP